MTNTSTIRIVALAMLLACAGCGAVVEISHSYPSDVPVPSDARTVHLGEFAVQSGPGDNLAQSTAKALAGELAATDYFVVQHATSGPAVADIEIAGAIYVTVRDDSGTRKIRMAPVGNELQEVPMLVRRVNVRIDFQLTDLRSGKPIGVVQTGMDYVSTEDPATCGPNGLLRSDDPKNVPPADQIVHRLIPECLKTLVSMILPARQTVKIALRPTSNEIGQRAISLAGKKKYAAALRPASVAVGMESSDALVFNLAVLSEATGHNEDALRYYSDAWELSDHQDMQARQGVRRMERLALMAQMPATAPASGPASTAPANASEPAVDTLPASVPAPVSEPASEPASIAPASEPACKPASEPAVDTPPASAPAPASEPVPSLLVPLPPATPAPSDETPAPAEPSAPPTQ